MQKTGSDCADVTWCGRLFQTREAAIGKARSPYVDNRVRRTTRDGEEAVSKTVVRQTDRPTVTAHCNVYTSRCRELHIYWHFYHYVALFSLCLQSFTQDDGQQARQANQNIIILNDNSDDMTANDGSTLRDNRLCVKCQFYFTSASQSLYIVAEWRANVHSQLIKRHLVLLPLLLDIAAETITNFLDKFCL